MTVAIQGQIGSFHHTASELFFNKPIEILPCESFREVFQTLSNGDADTGLVAIENSLYGSIHETYDMLVRHDFSIVGEITLPINQQLIVNPNTNLKDITEVYSHPAALDQCRNYLEANFPDVELIEHHDTAAAVNFIKHNQLITAAAIASFEAAKLHGMKVLAENIEDTPDNFTRFVVINRQSIATDNPSKASLILTTSHQSGSLYDALGVFKSHGVNLTKLESRPIRGETFRYQFFVDVIADHITLTTIIDELILQDCQVKQLGHYQQFI